jgi:hypothetical protein
MLSSLSPLKKAALGAMLVGSTLTGVAAGAAFITPASAQTPSSTSTSTAPAQDPSKGGHQANGITETLLTGDAAAKATAAAKAAVPGGTIERVENDAEGDAYEAHMVDANGNHVTVKLDSSFTLVRVEQGR